jgi:pimeloyl-ACP methyl ester carboxylesterase
MRDKLDRSLYATPLDQMVLIGHSMGGLVAELQTLQSGNAFWDLVSDRPLNELATVSNRDELAKTFYFEPNPSVRRVVSIATPHRGSNFSNGATQWLGRKLISVPQNVESSRSQALIDDPEFFADSSILRISNSVDAMSAKSPILPLMLSSPRAPWVKYHNIIGLLDDVRVIGRVVEGTDGVVAYESAHLDNVNSEITVSADHTNVHRSPRAILEVRRILLDHIAQLNGRGDSIPSVPLTNNQSFRSGQLAIQTIPAR